MREAAQRRFEQFPSALRIPVASVSVPGADQDAGLGHVSQDQLSADVVAGKLRLDSSPRLLGLRGNACG